MIGDNKSRTSSWCYVL